MSDRPQEQYGPAGEEELAFGEGRKCGSVRVRGQGSGQPTFGILTSTNTRRRVRFIRSNEPWKCYYYYTDWPSVRATWGRFESYYSVPVSNSALNAVNENTSQ